MDDWLALSPREVAGLMRKLKKKAGTNPASIGLTDDLVTQLETQAGAIETRETAVENTERDYRGAVKARDADVTSGKDLLRRMRKKVEASEATEQDRTEAGLPVSDGVSVPLMPPTDLVVVANGTVHKLKWKKNGNAAGVQYVIEAKIAEGEWTLLDVVTAAKFEHAGRTPGQRAMYRIKARKGGITSASSNEAGVYLS